MPALMREPLADLRSRLDARIKNNDGLIGFRTIGTFYGDQKKAFGWNHGLVETSNQTTTGASGSDVPATEINRHLDPDEVMETVGDGGVLAEQAACAAQQKVDEASDGAADRSRNTFG